MLEFIAVVRKSQDSGRDRPIIKVKCPYCSKKYNIRSWPGEIVSEMCSSCRNKMNARKRSHALKRMGIVGMSCTST